MEEENLKAVMYAKADDYQPGKTETRSSKRHWSIQSVQRNYQGLAVGKNKVVLVTSDHTRAVPSKITLPILLKEIRKGNPDADITILIAIRTSQGYHRGRTA